MTPLCFCFVLNLEPLTDKEKGSSDEESVHLLLTLRCVMGLKQSGTKCNSSVTTHTHRCAECVCMHSAEVQYPEARA